MPEAAFARGAPVWERSGRGARTPGRDGASVFEQIVQF
jgi:hypothetical protein